MFEFLFSLSIMINLLFIVIILFVLNVYKKRKNNNLLDYLGVKQINGQIDNDFWGE